MKRFSFAVALMLAAGVVLADTYVRGHTRSDGTYVQGHTRSSPDAYRNNNYGSESRGGNRRDEYSRWLWRKTTGYSSRHQRRCAARSVLS